MSGKKGRGVADGAAGQSREEEREGKGKTHGRNRERSLPRRIERIAGGRHQEKPGR